MRLMAVECATNPPFLHTSLKYGELITVAVKSRRDVAARRNRLDTIDATHKSHLGKIVGSGDCVLQNVLEEQRPGRGATGGPHERQP
jgi:CxxC motif-containing protein